MKKLYVALLCVSYAGSNMYASDPNETPATPAPGQQSQPLPSSSSSSTSTTPTLQPGTPSSTSSSSTPATIPTITVAPVYEEGEPSWEDLEYYDFQSKIANRDAHTSYLNSRSKSMSAPQPAPASQPKPGFLDNMRDGAANAAGQVVVKVATDIIISRTPLYWITQSPDSIESTKLKLEGERIQQKYYNTQIELNQVDKELKLLEKSYRKSSYEAEDIKTQVGLLQQLNIFKEQLERDHGKDTALPKAVIDARNKQSQALIRQIVENAKKRAELHPELQTK